MTFHRPIFVTGLPRGGTTWVGKMIACHRMLEYVHEPFNPGVSTASQYGLTVRQWFLHICPELEKPFLGPVRRIVELRPLLWSRMRAATGWRQRCRIWNHYRRIRNRRREGAAALIKDPIGFFSAEWLVRRFDARVVVVVRHPAAWVDSYLRTGWELPRDVFRVQPHLCNGLLRPYRDVLFAGEDPDDRIGRTSMTWSMFMHVVRVFAEKHPDWILVRHEDLSRNPLAGFERLYDRLGLKLSARCRDVIRESSEAPPDEADYTLSSIKRNSRASLGRWRTNLSAGAVERIRDLTAEYWPDFYEPGDW